MAKLAERIFIVDQHEHRYTQWVRQGRGENKNLQKIFERTFEKNVIKIPLFDKRI